MLTVKVILADGNSFTTGFNGTANEVISYYLGQSFEMAKGGGTYAMVKCIQVEISAWKKFWK